MSAFAAMVKHCTCLSCLGLILGELRCTMWLVDELPSGRDASVVKMQIVQDVDGAPNFLSQQALLFREPAIL